MEPPAPDERPPAPVDWRRASLWADRVEPAPRRGPPVDRAADVVVVGAGVTGLLTAWELHRAGADVLVLDRQEAGGVATRNTTAKVTALQGTAYRAITTARGAEIAAAYAAAQLDAVAGIRHVVAELSIDCALTEAAAITYATEQGAAARASEEYEAARAAGLPVAWTTETELPFPVAGAVRLDAQLHFHPEDFCRALADGLGPDRVLTGRAVEQVGEAGDGCTVVTAEGDRFTAGHVVVATQAPVVDPALLVNRCTPQQSYAIALRTAGPVPDGMYLSCDRAVRSLRPARVDGDTYAVVAGEGHVMGDPAATAARWDALESWGSGVLGGGTVTHRWATHDLVTTDHVPFVGRLAPGSHRRWVATGFAKWGMTNAFVAARIIAGGIAGRAPAWAGAFDATRIASTVNRELLSVGRRSARHLLVDRIARRDAPRCTHQGCVLREDAALGTWDCPCHGSRFDAHGDVVQGPATRPVDLGR